MSMKRVLLVEDDDATRLLIDTILREAGYEVVTALDGRHALRLAGSVRPDVLVVDLGLPLISGEELVSHLRRSGPLMDVPVVIVSARSDALQISRRVRATSVVPKPFDADVLVSIVGKSLTRAPLA